MAHPLPTSDRCRSQATRAQTKSASAGLSDRMAAALDAAPSGSCVCWGIPFEISEPVILSDRPVSVAVMPTSARWLVFQHTSDLRPLEEGPGGIISPMHGEGLLAEHAADYVIRYADGSEARAAIRRRRQIGAYRRRWGENCFEAVAHHKPQPWRAGHEQVAASWGWSQTRVVPADDGPWVNWLWAWENPHPEKTITGFRFEPIAGTVSISAISAGDVVDFPLRWQPRRKARLLLPGGETFRPELDKDGLLGQIQLDLGQVISATPRLDYPNDAWPDGYNNQLPELSSPRDADRVLRAPGSLLPPHWPRRQPDGPGRSTLKAPVTTVRRPTAPSIRSRPPSRRSRCAWSSAAEAGRCRSNSTSTAKPANIWRRSTAIASSTRPGSRTTASTSLTSSTGMTWSVPTPAPTSTVKRGSSCRWGRSISKCPRASRFGRCGRSSKSRLKRNRSKSSWKRSCPGASRAG